MSHCCKLFGLVIIVRYSAGTVRVILLEFPKMMALQLAVMAARPIVFFTIFCGRWCKNCGCTFLQRLTVPNYTMSHTRENRLRKDANVDTCSLLPAVCWRYAYVLAWSRKPRRCSAVPSDAVQYRLERRNRSVHFFFRIINGYPGIHTTSTTRPYTARAVPIVNTVCVQPSVLPPHPTSETPKSFVPLPLLRHSTCSLSIPLRPLVPTRARPAITSRRASSACSRARLPRPASPPSPPVLRWSASHLPQYAPRHRLAPSIAIEIESNLSSRPLFCPLLSFQFLNVSSQKFPPITICSYRSTLFGPAILTTASHVRSSPSHISPANCPD